MNAKTTAERVSALRQRREALGLVRLELWVHPNDVTRIKKDAERHASHRARILKQHGVVLDSMEDQEARLIAIAKKAPRKPKPYTPD